MSKPIPAAAFADAVPLRRNRAERTFDLPPALHLLTAGGYLAYLGVMTLAFGNPELALPLVICFVIVAAGFIVPGWWGRVAPKQVGRFQSFTEFLEEGIETHTGRLSGKGALAQVLIMPAMLLGWGLVIAAIRATV